MGKKINYVNSARDVVVSRAIELVSEYYGCDVFGTFNRRSGGKKFSHKEVYPRKVLEYIFYIVCDFETGEIAKITGVNRSTVSSSVKCVRENLKFEEKGINNSPYNVGSKYLIDRAWIELGSIVRDFYDAKEGLSEDSSLKYYGNDRHKFLFKRLSSETSRLAGILDNVKSLYECKMFVYVRSSDGSIVCASYSKKTDLLEDSGISEKIVDVIF